MSDDPKNKQTRKEGLEAAAREALERAGTETKSPKDAKTDPMTGEKRKEIDGPKLPPDEREAADKKTRKAAMLLAEYPTPGRCLHAAEKLRSAGYTKFDAHTPFPVHGMDRAMGLPDSRLGWIVITAALTGTACAFLMMWWMNCIDYPIIVGGKPASVSSIASMVPIMFELTILFSAFAAVFGMFAMNKIPMHHHPIFESDRFRAFSTGKFFISVEARDPKFKLDKTRDFLEKTHADFVELVLEPAAEAK